MGYWTHLRKRPQTIEGTFCECFLICTAQRKNNLNLKLVKINKDYQESAPLFIANGRRYFSAAYRLMTLPALNASGSPLKSADGTIFITPEHLDSALILFQLSFELLLKALIKLKASPPLSCKELHTHDLLSLWNLAAKYFPTLFTISKIHRDILEELSSSRKNEDGINESNLMRLKYCKSALHLSEGWHELLKSLSGINTLINSAISQVQNSM